MFSGQCLLCGAHKGYTDTLYTTDIIIADVVNLFSSRMDLNYAEEQANELEALQSIYPEELEGIYWEHLTTSTC